MSNDKAKITCYKNSDHFFCKVGTFNTVGNGGYLDCVASPQLSVSLNWFHILFL